MLLPSLIEGISISLLEAMAFSKTTVATDVGGNLELIENKKNGYLIKSKSVKDIKEIILKLKSDYDKNIGKNARERVVKYFSNSRMFSNYYKVLKQTIYDYK